MGTQFDLPTLAIISGLDPREAAAGLWKAMVAGMIIAPGENYFVVQDDKDDDGMSNGNESGNDTPTPSPSRAHTTTTPTMGENKLSSATSPSSYHPHISTRDALRSIRRLPIVSGPKSKVLTLASPQSKRYMADALDALDETGRYLTDAAFSE
jgi:hypothetical protein